jgi:DNA (cytosine-5)-methyltransferase 1
MPLIMRERVSLSTTSTIRHLETFNHPGMKPVAIEWSDRLSTIGILDLFAGPGGLGEGFASLESLQGPPFRIMISVEKERSAHATLRLRSFLREVVRKTGRLPEEYIDFHAGVRAEPDWASVDAAAWRHAEREARCLQLGTPEAAEVLDATIEEIAPTLGETVLIGGPPCQA